MRLRIVPAATILAVLLVLAAPLHAAETVHLWLKINGVPVKAGPQMGLEQAVDGAIECLYYEHSVSSGASPGKVGGAAAAAPKYGAIIIRKRVDAISPQIMQAVTKGQIAEGIIRFLRPNSKGVVEPFYTVEFKGGPIESVKQVMPSKTEPETANDPSVEEIAFTYSGISFGSVAPTPNRLPVRPR